MVLPASAITILLFGAALCLPPFLALRLFIRSHRRATRRRLSTRRFYLAISLALIAFMFNVGALIGTSVALTRGEMPSAQINTIALAIAWVCFWVWIFLLFALGRDLGRKSGLR